MHMRLEVWRPDLHLVFRDLGNSLSSCPRIYNSRTKACRECHRHLRTLYKQISYARPRPFVAAESALFLEAFSRDDSGDADELASYGLVWVAANFWEKVRRGQWGEGSFETITFAPPMLYVASKVIMR
jgi:hypothetical protein